MDLTIKLLTKSKEDKSFLSIWTYNDDEKFWFGKILDFNDELVIIQHYTKYGKKDGIIVTKISEIISIDLEDDYSKAMSYIIENSEELANETEFNFNYFDNGNWKTILLNQLNNRKDIITSIEINDDYFSGFIIEVDSESFIIKCIGSLGEDEGNALYKIEDLTGFKINDIDNRKRLMLFNWRKKDCR
ncbi:hypothetical protein [Chryseobacterium sp. R2A-55]|uniref:hypothetical protein n=1 Tax=Chryseobacterium sp. R2A-55 TaxID=2744445 RepID=UPI001F3D8840|nr:hypothetical protein [Chryseobacterium sp. R2A-55]